MANIYEPKTDTLADLLTRMGDNATMLIPDLQRDYVWDPNKIVLLMDSLLRGWPFGTLLLWEVEEDGPVRIPARPFWRVCDKKYPHSNSVAVTRSTNLRRGENLLMVLDGQQRLQSIFIAVGDHETGIIDTDYAWLRHHTGQRRDHRSEKRQTICPIACFCIDLEAFYKSYSEAGNNVTAINYADRILLWALNETTSGKPFVSKYGNFPLRSKKHHLGQYIRFSLLWDFAKCISPNDDFETLLQKPDNTRPGLLLDNWLLDLHVKEDDARRYRTSISKLLLNLRTLRETKIAYLKLLAAEKIGIVDEAEYNNMIVSIFTRMNNGGQKLTQEEITFAWLKRGWKPDNTKGKDAQACFRELRDCCSSQYNVAFSFDELITGTGLCCSMLRRDGQMIRSGDLLDGALISNYAKWFCEEWLSIKCGVESVLGHLKTRTLLYRQHYHSLYGIGILWSWKVLADKWKEKAPSVADKADAQMKIDRVLSDYCDRWLLCSSWAGLWSSNSAKNTQEHLKNLALKFSDLSVLSWNNAGMNILAELHAWVHNIEAKAEKYVNDLVAANRGEVVAYRPLLWVWHRLNALRWEHSKDLMRDPHNRSDGRLEVDHCVSVDVWTKMLVREGFHEVSVEYSKRFSIINLLGNCTLLHKSLNSSKKGDQMDTFLSKISSLNIQRWQESLGISDKLIHPEAYMIDEVIAAIELRDKDMRKELCDFIKGEIVRKDLLS